MICYFVISRNINALLAETLWTKTPERRSWYTEKPPIRMQSDEDIYLRKKPEQPDFDFGSIKDELSKIQEIELQDDDDAAEVGSWESNFMKVLNWFSMGSAEPSEITEPTKRRQNKDVFGNSMSSFYNH